MLERLEGLPSGVEGLKAVGKVSMADYEAVIEPMLSQARREGSQLRFLYQLGPEFEGFTPGGVWEDAKLGLSSMQIVSRLCDRKRPQRTARRGACRRLRHAVRGSDLPER